MTVTSDRHTQQTALSVDAFLARYGDSNRYELIDGEVFDLDPRVSMSRSQPLSPQNSASKSMRLLCLGLFCSEAYYAPLARG